MAITFTSSGEQALNSGIKICVQGASGSGKTVLCGTAPDPIILSAERGTLSVASKNIPMLIVSTYKELIEAHTLLLSDARFKRFQTICLDSVTEIAEKLLSEEKGKSKDARAAYGEMQDKMQVVIRMFRDFPNKHVYFTTKSEIREQPDGTHKWSPMMPGKSLSNGLAYFFDEFFYLGVGETVAADGKATKYRYLQTGTDHLAEAKDRSGVLDQLEPPDLTHIFNKIRGAFTPKA